MKLSLDVKAFKDTLLRPQQRMLFGKQARRVVALDAETSSVCSVSSGDEEYSERVYFERREAELRHWKFESEMDKKLILGVMDRHVELLEERHAAVYQNYATPLPNSGAANNSDSGSVSG